MQYWYNNNGQQDGPYQYEELKKIDLADNVLVFRSDQTEWKPKSFFKELETATSTNITESSFGDSFIETEQNVVLANRGLRFVNYIIDFIGYMIFAFVGGMMIGLGEELGIGDGLEILDSSFGANLFGIIVIISYYMFFEYFLNGKTLGKYLTKTRAVTSDLEKMEFGTTLGRTLCRFIPFEPISLLIGNKAWHDNISNTIVIKEQ